MSFDVWLRGISFEQMEGAGSWPRGIRAPIGGCPISIQVSGAVAEIFQGKTCCFWQKIMEVFQPQRSSNINSNIKKYTVYDIFMHRNTSKWKTRIILLNILEQLSSQAASGDLWDSLLLRCFCAHGFAWDASYAELHPWHSETRRLGGDMVMALQSTLPDVPHTCWGNMGPI